MITPADLAGYQAKAQGKKIPDGTPLKRGQARTKKSGRIPHTTCCEDGYVFASRAEWQRYLELKMLQAARIVRSLRVHHTFTLEVNGYVVGEYTCDFDYFEKRGRIWVYEVEDVKSEFTRKDSHYRRQRKLMLACHGITIREVIR